MGGGFAIQHRGITAGRQVVRDADGGHGFGPCRRLPGQQRLGELVMRGRVLGPGRCPAPALGQRRRVILMICQQVQQAPMRALLLWPDQLYRPTRDVDLLGFGDPTPERLRRIFVEICAASFPEDALLFDTASVTAEPIRTIQDYGGVRVTLVASLGKARIPLQIDIGFGDAITPKPRDVTFPTLLPLDAPKVRAYPLETVIAEKFDAVVRLGRANSRMKDFHDL
ncbi:MAG: nucleotidyl transferase AbiEii/AbiGii toxin family protein, partial [Planctomycetota bacterium]